MAILFFMGRNEIWSICLILFFCSTFNAFRWPALSSMTTLLVAKKQLGRASGLMQVGEATAQIISPLLAGLLIATIKIHGVILIDTFTFLLSFITLLIVRIPKPEM